MKWEDRYSTVLRAIQNYIFFFLTVAFVISCCMMLFISVFASTLDLELTGENLAKAAKLTFLNVVLLSLILTAIDAIRRKLTVDRAVKRIINAADRVVNGDFNARIEPIGRFATDGNFNKIILCLNQLTDELSHVETLRTDFVANVSHEMKTPLSVIQNYATILQDPDLSDDKRMEYAKALGRASRRLSDMMTNILKLNRLENQQIYPRAAKYDLGEQLCESLLGYEEIWENKKIEIETDIGENITVFADAELLELVWNNLLSNAFKFTEREGKVSLVLSADERYATVKISDTGCGMSAEVGAHIFEKFYQGDSSRATEGNGLGLPLVKRVVDIVGGEISVRSEVGVGSTFTVKLRRDCNGQN